MTANDITSDVPPPCGTRGTPICNVLRCKGLRCPMKVSHPIYRNVGHPPFGNPPEGLAASPIRPALEARDV